MTGCSVRAFARIVTALALSGGAAFAQLPSKASLKGAYYVRYLGENTANSAVMSFQGTFTFDGAGNYTVPARAPTA